MSKWDGFDSALDLARAMWTPQAADLPLDRFQTLFHRVYDTCHDVPTLWQLGGATNDYLRIHPGTLTVPHDLPIALLHSNDVEARIVGLKLLNRCIVADELIVSEIVRAMQRRDQYESSGGFHELDAFLDRRQANGSATDPDLVNRLQQVLATFCEDGDDDTRRSANHLMERLADM